MTRKLRDEKLQKSYEDAIFNCSRRAIDDLDREIAVFTTLHDRLCDAEERRFEVKVVNNQDDILYEGIMYPDAIDEEGVTIEIGDFYKIKIRRKPND